jgi:crotonobetainyl-CoA:carnitine CoA-transferase CaiB-like acyl-CoA transferase
VTVSHDADDYVDATTTRRGPLTGVRVLDASTMLASPYTAGLLGDFGADVIKVEDCGDGDPMRRLAMPERGQSLFSKTTNRNKRSISIDLRSEEGRDVFRRLAGEVDVVITNFRMSTLETWGLTYESLSSGHPSLVMYHLSAYGPTGPRRDDPGFARVAEAYSGLTYASGEADGPPMFSGYAIADGVGGVHGAFSVMLALFEVQRTGRGQFVECSLAGSMLRLMEGFIAAYDGTGVSPTRTGNRNNIVPNGIYRTADDRWIVVPATSPNMWTRLCRVLNLEELLDDPRFTTNAERLQHRDELEAILVPQLESRTFDELYTLLREAGVAVGPVNSMEDLFADDSMWEQGALIRVADEHLERGVAMPGIVPQLSATPGGVHHVGPERGQHTAEVLSEVLGLDQAEIVALVDAGAVALAD